MLLIQAGLLKEWLAQMVCVSMLLIVSLSLHFSEFGILFPFSRILFSFQELLNSPDVITELALCSFSLQNGERPLGSVTVEFFIVIFGRTFCFLSRLISRLRLLLQD